MPDEERRVPRDTSRDLHIGHNTRRYLPTLADLLDRLSIVQLKEIFLSEYRDEYARERALIEHDIDIILDEMHARDGFKMDAAALRAVMMLMLSNRVIWENESKARSGGSEQDKLLKFTHSINGIRTTAKNFLAKMFGERRDWKVDCLAADLPSEFGNWNVF
jgi:hypothetical protein